MLPTYELLTFFNSKDIYKSCVLPETIYFVDNH